MVQFIFEVWSFVVYNLDLRILTLDYYKSAQLEFDFGKLVVLSGFQFGGKLVVIVELVF